MYNNYYGIFNYLGKTLGLIDKNINWLGDERFALGCIILILLTTSVGQPIVLYVSALGNVDQSIVEAAEVDGATDFQCFWKIKWPAIMPTTLYMMVSVLWLGPPDVSSWISAKHWKSVAPSTSAASTMDWSTFPGRKHTERWAGPQRWSAG